MFCPALSTRPRRMGRETRSTPGTFGIKPCGPVCSRNYGFFIDLVRYQLPAPYNALFGVPEDTNPHSKGETVALRRTRRYVRLRILTFAVLTIFSRTIIDSRNGLGTSMRAVWLN